MSSDGKFTRRRFLQAAGLLGAAGMGSMMPGAKKATAAGGMPQRVFGKTGVKVPILSMGTMFDTINNQIVLRQALALGVTHWDTAAMYQGGQSEVGIGKFFSRHKGARQKIFLVSKTSGARSTGDMTALLDQSLKKMHTDYLDLLFIHSVTDVGDDVFPDAAEWAARAKKSGKIRYFGFSTHRNMADCLKDAAKLDFIDAVMFSYNFRLMQDADMIDAMDACHAKGIALTAMKTQGGGPVRTDDSREMKLAGGFVKKGFTPEQAKLKAVWGDKRIATLCSQMPTVAILRANTAAAMDRVKLSRGDHEALRQYAKDTCDEYCAGCGALCQGAMGGAVPVAEVMRALMYRRSHGEAELAREVFAELSQEVRERLASEDFKPAEAVCPQGLPVARLMREAARVLA